MKKVSGYVSVRPLGTYDFEFYVENDTTDFEITKKIEEIVQLSFDYHVEEGYEAVQETVYQKIDS